MAYRHHSPRFSTGLSTLIPHNREINVIIVHYGNTRTIYDLVSTLLHAQDSLGRIIVVDHGPDCLVLEEDPLVYVVRSPNTGYWGGIMAGVLHMSEHSVIQDNDIILCMNNDIEVHPDAIRKICNWWLTAPRKVIAGPILCVCNNVSGRTKCAEKSGNAWYKFSYVHGALFGAPYEFFKSFRPIVTGSGRQISTPYDVGNLFLYWEDVAVSLIAHEVTYDIVKIPHVSVVHVDHGRKSEDDRLYYLVRNGAYVLERYQKAPWKFYWRVVNRLRVVYHGLLSVFSTKHRLVARALRDAVRGRLGRVENKRSLW